MNSKKQTRILPEANFGYHDTSKVELSVKYLIIIQHNTSSVNRTVTENDKILETERGNSSPISNSK